MRIQKRDGRYHVQADRLLTRWSTGRQPRCTPLMPITAGVRARVQGGGEEFEFNDS